MKKRHSGFNVTKQLVVLGIVIIIGLFVFPTALRGGVQGNESAALGHIRAIVDAQMAYRSENSRYASTFDELESSESGSLDDNWVVALKTGYSFTMTSTKNGYTVNADPILPGTTGKKHYYSNGSGVIRFDTTGAADNSSTPIDKIEVAKASGIDR